MSNRKWSPLLLTLSLALSGCGRIDVRLPTAEPVGRQVVHVISHPGEPITILEQVTVKGRLHDGSEIQQDIGGWRAMPDSHFQFLIEQANRGMKSE